MEKAGPEHKRLECNKPFVAGRMYSRTLQLPAARTRFLDRLEPSA